MHVLKSTGVEQIHRPRGLTFLFFHAQVCRKITKDPPHFCTHWQQINGLLVVLIEPRTSGGSLPSVNATRLLVQTTSNLSCVGASVWILREHEGLRRERGCCGVRFATFCVSLAALAFACFCRSFVCQWAGNILLVTTAGCTPKEPP